MAGCCHPIPGESIVGVVTQGSRGIAVHRQGCQNVDRIPPERLIPICWNESHLSTVRQPTFPVEICVETIDRVGVLKDILTRLTDANINVHRAQVQTRPGETATISLGIDICDRTQLDRVFAHIRKMSDVLDLRRIFHTADA